MRLAVICGTEHHLDARGRICTLAPTVAQLDQWAELFDQVVICAPLHAGLPPAGFAPYRATNVRLVPLRSAGGNTLVAKLGLLRHVIPWALATRRVARSVDGVHLRCPSNIGLVSIFSTWGTGCRRYAIYAGAWHDYPGEPRFFRLQRRLLGSRWFGGPVSVYADRDPSRPNLQPFFSPSYSAAEVERTRDAAMAKQLRIADGSAEGPWRLVTAGRLTPNKNQRTIVAALPHIVARGVDATLDIYGDGPLLGQLEDLALELDVADRVTFHGSVDHAEVMAAFEAADLNLLSTRQEGFGKVLLEGMLYGTVPVFSTSPVSGEISGGGSRGVVFPADDPVELADAVARLVGDRDRWAAMSEAARAYASSMTLEAFQGQVRELLERQWAVRLRTSAPVRGNVA